MKSERESFPSMIEVVFVVIALFVTEYLIAALLHDVRALSGVHPYDVAGAIAVLGNGILFSVLMHYKGLDYRSLFHSSRNSVAATVGTLTLPVLLLIPGLLMTVSAIQAALVATFPLSNWERAMFEQMMSGSVASVVTVCVLAPVLEEMLFRGIILRGFLNRYRRDHAILASAVLFGAAHLNIYQFAVGVLLGVVSGWLYERTRSLWPCILLHATYNSAIAWIFFVLAGGVADQAWNPPAVFWVGAFVLSFAGATLLNRFLAPARTA